jgi:hypothetical protein
MASRPSRYGSRFRRCRCRPGRTGPGTGHAHLRSCGCGGPAPASSTWTWPGGPMSAGSTWNTPSGSASRPLAGRPQGRGIPPRPTGGPGWCWPPPPSCAWPARSPPTPGCRGRCLDPSRDCHPTGYAADFRGCCAYSARRRPRRNPPDPCNVTETEAGHTADEPRRWDCGVAGW